jgi:Fe-S cluster assembly protein SufD
MSETGETTAGNGNGNGATPVKVKAGRHRDATLYQALAGAGAGDGRSLGELREAALKAFEGTELPVWRRSGFWTTSLQSLDFDGLRTSVSEQGVPEVVTSTIPERPRAGRIVQSAGAIVHVELDPALAERGVILSSLEEAFERHPQLVAEWFSRRLPIDRHKLEAANAAFWTGGIFLHVPDGLVVEEPFELVYAIADAGIAQYGRTLIVGGRSSEFKVHEYELAGELGAGDGETAQALHAGAFELYLQDGARCRLAQLQDWGAQNEVFDVTTRFVGVGRDAYCHWLPALLGGHLVRQHLELAVSEPGGDMAFRGLFFAEGVEHLDVFAADLHETGPSGGDVHWRGAASGQSRASFEGLIQIDPGAQQTHTYLQIHTMMLSPKARVDAIPSVLVSSDDVSASHGGTVGELDESAIFYMQSRGLDRASAVRVIVEGFFEPLIAELADEPLEELVREKIAVKLAAAREDIETYATSR